MNRRSFLSRALAAVGATVIAPRMVGALPTVSGPYPGFPDELHAGTWPEQLVAEVRFNGHVTKYATALNRVEGWVDVVFEFPDGDVVCRRYGHVDFTLVPDWRERLAGFTHGTTAGNVLVGLSGNHRHLRIPA